MSKKTTTKSNQFNLKLENSKILKVIIDTLSNIIDETEIQITPKEFIIQAMDPSRICLLKLKIDKVNFDEFKCTDSMTIGINLDDLDKILKRSDKNDTIELAFEENSQKLKVKMIKENRVRNFSLAILDLDIDEIPMENLLSIEYNVQWKLDIKILEEAIKDAEIYSEVLNIKAEVNQGLIFSSSGQIGEMEYEIGEDDLIENNIDDTSVGSFSTTFLKHVLKLAPITEDLSISSKTGHPLRFDFTLLEGGVLNYFLAPRVSEPDFDDDNLEEIEVEN